MTAYEQTSPAEQDSKTIIKWQLISISDDLGELTIPVVDGMTIGRGKDCDVVIASKQISRNHAVINLDQGAVELIDLGSSNGTFVNEDKLEAQVVTVLNHMDKLSFASFEFQVERSNVTDQLSQPIEIEDEETSEIEPPLSQKTVADSDLTSKQDDEIDTKQNKQIDSTQSDLTSTTDNLSKGNNLDNSQQLEEKEHTRVLENQNENLLNQVSSESETTIGTQNAQEVAEKLLATTDKDETSSKSMVNQSKNGKLIGLMLGITVLILIILMVFKLQ